MFGQSKFVKLAHFELSTLPHRKDFNCYYTLHEVTEMIEQPMMGNISPEKFFNFAQQNAKCVASRKDFATIEDETKFVQNQANLIGLVGRAGTGKTTLIKTLLAKACGKACLYNSDYIFYINMNIFDSPSKMDISDFIGSNLNIFRKQPSFCEHELSDNVLILVDGLSDSFSEENAESNLDINIKSKAAPQSFSKKIAAFSIKNKFL